MSRILSSRLVCMDRDDKCRAKAEEARIEAARSTNEVQRAAWLRMAQSWLCLIHKRDPETKQGRLNGGLFHLAGEELDAFMRKPEMPLSCISGLRPRPFC